MFVFVPVIGHVPYWYFNKRCHIMFLFHVYDLTFISGEGGDGVGVTEEKATKPLTKVRDCISTFESETPLAILRVRCDNFQLCLWWRRQGYLWQEVWTSPIVFVETKTGMAKTFLTFTRGLWCLNLTRSITALSHPKEENRTWRNIKLQQINVKFQHSYIANIYSGSWRKVGHLLL